MTVRPLLLSIALTCLAGVALAHTPLKNSQPADGSKLATSPERLILEFGKPVRLTRLRVESENGGQRQLEYTPSEASATFQSAAPNLAPGRNTIHWTALSPDGHVIEGTIVITVRSDP